MQVNIDQSCAGKWIKIDAGSNCSDIYQYIAMRFEVKIRPDQLIDDNINNNQMLIDYLTLMGNI